MRICKWKLQLAGKGGYMSCMNKYYVLHLDHPRSHFDKPQWLANRRILEVCQANVNSALDKDCAICQSLLIKRIPRCSASGLIR